MINIYCDGGCASNQTKENIGGWGTVLVYGKHVKELNGGANGWKNSKKEPVENRELWQELLDLVARQPKVVFFKVKGHLDIEDEKAIKKWHQKFINDYNVNIPYQDYLQAVKYNNRADSLANMAIDELR